MAGIFTRGALDKIMGNADLTPEQRTEQATQLSIPHPTICYPSNCLPRIGMKKPPFGGSFIVQTNYSSTGCV